MRNNEHWITAIIAEAHNSHPSVTDPLLARIDKLLDNQLSERPLRPAELTAIAKDLLSDMLPTPSESEENQ